MLAGFAAASQAQRVDLVGVAGAGAAADLEGVQAGPVDGGRAGGGLALLSSLLPCHVVKLLHCFAVRGSHAPHTPIIALGSVQYQV